MNVKDRFPNSQDDLEIPLPKDKESIKNFINGQEQEVIETLSEGVTESEEIPNPISLEKVVPPQPRKFEDLDEEEQKEIREEVTEDIKHPTKYTRMEKLSKKYDLPFLEVYDIYMKTLEKLREGKHPK